MNNFVNINEHCAKEIHLVQDLLRSQTHVLNGFTTMYTANAKIKQIANVHECS